MACWNLKCVADGLNQNISCVWRIYFCLLCTHRGSVAFPCLHVEDWSSVCVRHLATNVRTITRRSDPQFEWWTVKTISCCARADGVSNLFFGVRGFWNNCLMRVMCKWYLLIVTGLSFGLLTWSIFSLFKVKSTWETVSNPCSLNVV